MTAHEATAHLDLITGNFVAAYGLPTPAPALSGLVAVQSPALPSVIQFVSARRARVAGTRHPDAEAPIAPPQASVTDTLPHDSRGPEGGAPPAAGAGGTAGPMALMKAFALVAERCLKFVPPPTAHFMCVDARRLERPG
ncbi:MAG: hypothetical protein JO039_21895 [Solirubrobacterales bacterium]|nr:hypothetical protein [Solirubrobacterales bacterium]